MFSTPTFIMLFIAGSAYAYSITYTIENHLKADNFTYSMEMDNANTPFYNLMVRAQELSSNFSYTSQDYGGDLGQFITSINGVENNYTNPNISHYWGFLLRNQTSACKLPVGVSSFVPSEGDHVVFSYTTSVVMDALSECIIPNRTTPENVTAQNFAAQNFPAQNFPISFLFAIIFQQIFA